MLTTTIMSVYILLSYLTSSSSIRVISNNLWSSLKLSRARDETSFGLEPSNPPSIDNFALPSAISAAFGTEGAETGSSTRNEGRFYLNLYYTIEPRIESMKTRNRKHIYET